MAEYNLYSQRMQDWLRTFGFVRDPFAVCVAEQEQAYLPELLIDRPYLDSVFGDPTRPQTTFLSAGRGDGKTASREMVAYECSQHGRHYRRVLAVNYCDFGALLEKVNGDLTQITARHHVDAIARATLTALAADVPPATFDALTSSDRDLLLGYVAAFPGGLATLKLPQVVAGVPVSLPWADLPPAEILKTLAELVTKLGQREGFGYEAVYVLVDRVDETALGPHAAVPLLMPLVADGALLAMPHVAFKLFLPAEVGVQLRRSAGFRQDRYPVYQITWDATALRQMLEQRLSYYSDDKVKHLEDLCTAAAGRKVFAQLANACANSPRGLLRWCEILLRCHVERTVGRPEEKFFTLDDINGALTQFKAAVHDIILPKYDVFISHSSQDKRWVREWLVPKLEGTHLRVCVDWRDFAPGIPRLVEIERAILQSRTIVIVLGPDYVGDHWKSFESSVTQYLDISEGTHRLLPLLRTDCEVPPRLKSLVCLDFAHTKPSEREAQLQRLIDAIRSGL